MNNKELNNLWKTYFNWNIFFFPILLLGMILLLAFSLLAAFIGPTSYGDLTAVFFFLTIIAIIGYGIYYFKTSDQLFKELEQDRLLFNIINILLLFIFPMCNTLIMTMIIMFKMRNYWKERKINFSWRGIAIPNK